MKLFKLAAVPFLMALPLTAVAQDNRDNQRFQDPGVAENVPSMLEATRENEPESIHPPTNRVGKALPQMQRDGQYEGPESISSGRYEDTGGDKGRRETIHAPTNRMGRAMPRMQQSAAADDQQDRQSRDDGKRARRSGSSDFKNDDVSASERENIRNALNEWNCRSGKYTKEQDFRLFEVEDADCDNGYQYDIKLDSNFEVLYMSRG